MSLIKIYKNSPTAGGTNGTLVSSGTGANPIESGAIEVPSSGYEEGEWIKLAVRCDSGYKTVEKLDRHVRLSIEDSGGVDKWQLAPDNAGSAGTPSNWGSFLDINSEVGATNTIFWARARVAHTEEPMNDATVDIRASALIGAV